MNPLLKRRLALCNNAQCPDSQSSARIVKLCLPDAGFALRQFYADQFLPVFHGLTRFGQAGPDDTVHRRNHILIDAQNVDLADALVPDGGLGRLLPGDLRLLAVGRQCHLAVVVVRLSVCRDRGLIRILLLNRQRCCH